MGKKSRIVFLMLLGLFVTGILAGSIFQVRINEQTEMYEYLKGGVADYKTGISGSIKAVWRDNLPELCILAVSPFLPFGVFLVGGVLALRAFMTGFALTAVLRTYGISGMLLCLGNIASCLVVVPCLMGFGIFILSNTYTKSRVKLFIFCTLFLILLLLLDSFIKGTLCVLMAKVWR